MEGCDVIRAILLAAGKGTRMKSARTKVLHELCGRPMLWFVIEALRRAGIADILVVTNAELQECIGEFGVEGVVQPEQRGTGDAVRVALEALPPRSDGRILVAYGDMPLISEEAFAAVASALQEAGAGSAMALVTVKMPLPSSFGRIVREGHSVERIVRRATRRPRNSKSTR